MHDFSDDPDVSSASALVQGRDGNFYGTTCEGGSSGSGTVFELVVKPSSTVSPPIVNGGTLAGEVGARITYQIAASNTPTSFSSNGLPPGLSLVTSSGSISGTFTQAGTFPVTLGATNSAGTGTAVLTFTVAPFGQALPVVSLAATVPTVTVGSGEVGEFTLSLDTVQDHDVVVAFTIKGTAVNGTDHTLLTGTKKIKTGKTSKPIKVIPQGDLGGASKKTVVLELTPSDGYTVGTTGKVKIKITTGQ